MGGRDWGRTGPWGAQLSSRASLHMPRAHWCVCGGGRFAALALGGWVGGLVEWVRFEGCSFFSVLVMCI